MEQDDQPIGELTRTFECCEPGDHVFTMDGPPPWSCVFCGYTPNLTTDQERP